MKKIAIFLCWLTGVSLQIAQPMRADELPWQDDVAKAQAESAEKHLPILLDFSAPWCGPCRMMETTTFADGDVREALRQYVLVKVNLDEAHELAAHFRVEAIPTCILLNQFGEKAAEHTGYQSALDFRRWLHASEGEAFVLSSKADQMTAGFKSLNTALEASDEPTRAKALAVYLEGYCKPDAGEGTAKRISEELRAWVGRHPDRAMPLLNDRRLAVRVLFTALFAEKLGSGFQFDPWDKADERAAAVERLCKLIEIPSR